MFQNARSRVNWGGKIGELFENVYGVLQGGVMSPILFKFVSHDMTEYLTPNNGFGIGNTKMNYLLFADDLVLLSESPSGLQNLINNKSCNIQQQICPYPKSRR